MKHKLWIWLVLLVLSVGVAWGQQDVTPGTSAATRTVVVVDDTTTNATMYPAWFTAATGKLAAKVSTTKLYFNPSTGLLTATGFGGPLTGNVTGNVSGSSGSCTGNAATATAAATSTIVDDTTTNATMYPLWATAITGNLALKGSSSKLYFNPSTGLLTATGFSGPLTGNVTGNASGSAGTCTGNAGSATYASATTVADDTTTVATMYPLWVTTTTGNLPTYLSSTKLSFVPSTGILTATGFSGALTGNVTGNASGSSGSCTGNAATATTAVSLSGEHVKVGTLTRDMTAETGDVPYTGVGFTPSVISFFGGIAAGSTGCLTSFNGNDDGTNRQCIYNSNTVIYTSIAASILFKDATGFQYAYVKTKDADGFTLTWTKSGTPGANTATVFYKADR